MTSTELRYAIDRLGLSQVGLATFLHTDPRTVRRWAADDLPIPHAVAMLLRIMVAKRITPARMTSLAAQPLDIV